MDVELEIIARKVGLTIHDRIHNELSSAFQFYNVARCIDNRYTIKSHETNLAMVKYRIDGHDNNRPQPLIIDLVHMKKIIFTAFRCRSKRFLAYRTTTLQN